MASSVHAGVGSRDVNDGSETGDGTGTLGSSPGSEASARGAEVFNLGSTWDGAG
jgi:hypothetical protein